MKHNYSNFLRKVDFLAGLPERTLENIGQSLHVERYREDRCVFREGAPADAAYFIYRGEVRIQKNGARLFIFRAGSYIGEMALIDNSPRSADAVAATDVTLLRWKRDSFLETLSSDSRVLHRICASLVSRLREDIAIVARVQEERRRAAEVQRAMLPAPKLRTEMLDLVTYCRQADDVGGDYYDYFTSTEGARQGLIIADVQGHGFSAALLVAVLKTNIRVSSSTDPEMILASLNRTILHNISEVLTATSCCIVFDRHARTFKYASAGHITQYHYRSRTETVDELRSQNLLLGVPGQEDYEFSGEVREWEDGDLIVLFSDGLTEASNAAGEEFGAGRVREIIHRYGKHSIEIILDTFCKDLTYFTGAQRFIDDVTLIVVRLS